VGIAEELLTEEYRRAREERQRELAGRWNIYEGKHEKPLKVKPSKDGRPAVDDNVTPNLVGLFVDKGVSFLTSEPPSFALVKDDDAGGAMVAEGNVDVPIEEQHLDKVWRLNHAKTLLHKTATNGGVAGHAWLRLLVPEQPVIHPVTELPIPRIINVDPHIVDVLYDQDDIELELGYLLEWEVFVQGRPAIRRQLIDQGDAGDSWVITDLISRGDSKSYEEFGNGVTTWPFPFPPLLGWQNLPSPNVYYGKADIDGGLIDLNAAVNRALSNLARIVRFHAHPKTWASGISHQRARQGRRRP
jgi:hypothetical protein